MEIFQKNKNEAEVFSIKGSLDSNTAAEFETSLYSTFEAGKTKIILNLENLDYISSAGIRVMLKATKDLKKIDGKIILCSLQDYVMEVFDIAGFVGYLNIAKNLDDALASI